MVAGFNMDASSDYVEWFITGLCQRTAIITMVDSCGL